MRKRRELTIAEAAEALGLSHQAVGQWAAKPAAPVRRGKAGKSLLLWPDFPRWREQQLAAIARPLDLAESDRRERQARTEIVEMKRDTIRGKLVLRSDYEAELRDIAGRLSAGVRSIRGRYVRGVIGLTTEAEAAKVLRKIERGLLEELRGAAD